MLFVFGGINSILSSPWRNNEICVLLSHEKKEGNAEIQKKSSNKRGRAREGEKGEREMINPIKPLSVSSIGIVLRWLPLPSSGCGLQLG